MKYYKVITFWHNKPCGKKWSKEIGQSRHKYKDDPNDSQDDIE